jgi:hypothetical protein
MVNEDRMDGFGGGKDAIKKVRFRRCSMQFAALLEHQLHLSCPCPLLSLETNEMPSTARLLSLDAKSTPASDPRSLLQVVESRVKTDWGEQGTGGAKGQTYKGPSSFEV